MMSSKTNEQRGAMNSIRKHTQNVVVDIVSFVCMIILMVTGILIHFKLPKGSKGATVWGLSRHEWGEFHFWVAAVLIVAITFHVLLHIPWIKGVVYPKKNDKKRTRVLIYSITFMLILAVGVAVLLSPVKGG